MAGELGRPAVVAEWQVGWDFAFTFDHTAFILARRSGKSTFLRAFAEQTGGMYVTRVDQKSRTITVSSKESK